MTRRTFTRWQLVGVAVVGALVGLWLSPGRGYAVPVAPGVYPASVAPSVAPCRLEDSPGPCVWDARHRGNGAGQSFRRWPDGTTVRISHRRAHRLTHD